MAGKTLLRGTVAVAALGMALLAPATASATTAYETLNGYPGPCGHDNFSLPKGTPVQIKVCHKEDGYCTGWKDVQDA